MNETKKLSAKTIKSSLHVKLALCGIVHAAISLQVFAQLVHVILVTFHAVNARNENEACEGEEQHISCITIYNYSLNSNRKTTQTN